MTKEQTIEAAKVMLAWAEGKPVECRIKGCSSWVSFENEDEFDFIHCYYRIKPEPKYRPYKTSDEVMEAIKEHGDWVKCKMSGRCLKVVEVSECTIWAGCYATRETTQYLYDEAFNALFFADGTPFGMLEE